jgi:glycosyltransferase involved in cell wall biosynthesis
MTRESNFAEAPAASMAQLDATPRPAYSARPSCADIGVCLLTGGIDRPYVFGLAMALARKGVTLEVIGNREVDSPEMHTTANLSFLNLYWDGRERANIWGKIRRVLQFYWRVGLYSTSARPRIFHILWNNKLLFFDRTLLMLYYKALGKKIVFTAHNVNAGKRDSEDSVLNRATLWIQYHLADHIFVHTSKMKEELRNDFGISESDVTTIPFGINNAVPNTDLTPLQARERLGIGATERTILFFGAVREYKGLEYLVSAFNHLEQGCYRLIIAGEPKKGTDGYLENIQRAISLAGTGGRIIQKLEFISDEDTEIYFKASDVCVLPYTLVFQSGVLFLAYSFGVPVVATDVGSFGEDILPGKTGFLCRSRDAVDLAGVLKGFFESELYTSRESRRQEIQDNANARHSWELVGDMTGKIYSDLLTGTV